MNPEVKQKWVNALRSGKYKQAQYNLKSGYGYCCLGVLTDLYIKENDLKWTYDDAYDTYDFNEFEGSLCNTVIKWSDFPDGATEDDLIAMNDSKQKTFSEIADYIEENL